METTEKQLTYAVATINNVQILVIDNGEKRIAIKPICDALGISHQAQIEKLKKDPILSSTVMLSMTVGGDNKTREMTTIPALSNKNNIIL